MNTEDLHLQKNKTASGVPGKREPLQSCLSRMLELHGETKLTRVKKDKARYQPRGNKNENQKPPDFFSTTLNARRGWSDIYRVLMELNCIANILKMSITGHTFLKESDSFIPCHTQWFSDKHLAAGPICSVRQWLPPWHISGYMYAYSQHSPAQDWLKPHPQAPDPRLPQVNRPTTGRNLAIRLTFSGILAKKRRWLSATESERSWCKIESAGRRSKQNRLVKQRREPRGTEEQRRGQLVPEELERALDPGSLYFQFSRGLEVSCSWAPWDSLIPFVHMNPIFTLEPAGFYGYLFLALKKLY